MPVNLNRIKKKGVGVTCSVGTKVCDRKRVSVGATVFEFFLLLYVHFETYYQITTTCRSLPAFLSLSLSFTRAW